MADESELFTEDWQDYWAVPTEERTIRQVHLMVLSSLKEEAAQLHDPLLAHLYDLVIAATYGISEGTSERPAGVN